MATGLDSHYDAIIIGAGGAGMMCAIHAGKRYRNVLVLDHAAKLGGKILISGGGRCNFTNLGASPAQYVSQNPHFMKSAMSRFTPRDFIEMVEAHGIAYHEKKLGQQFCDESAQNIVEMLKKECDEAGAKIELNSRILSVKALGERSFEVRTYERTLTCESLVIATGGLSIPKIGATGFGYEIAKQFKLKLVERAAALDGFTLNNRDAEVFDGLAGVSVDTIMTTNGISFRENILFTHAGLSGPATLQASLHWRKGDEVVTNLVPEKDAFQWFLQKKKEGNKALVRNLMSELIPGRLADRLCALYYEQGDLPLPQVSEKALEAFCKQYLHAWTIIPSGTVGYSKAEVTRGGVDTDELSSKTMEAKKVPGLYFIGEVVDVTGWLGGYNFQWAWASGAAAGQVV
jgi:predicted Rossmann fold flavoprotein